MSTRDNAEPDALIATPSASAAAVTAASLGEALVDCGPDLILVLREDGTVVAANRAALATLGVASGDLLGRPFGELVHEHDRALLPDDGVGLVSYRPEINLAWEVRLRVANGEYQLASGKAADLRDDERVGGVLVTLRLVDEPGRMLVSRQLLLAAVEAANSSIVIGDARLPDFPLTYANSGFRQLTGYEHDEILGNNCRFLQERDGARDEVGLASEAGGDPDDGIDQTRSLKAIRDALRNREFVNTVLRNYRKDGTLFYNDLYLTPVFVGDSYVGFIGVQNDVTERVMAERTTRQRQRLLGGFFNAAPMLLGVLEVGGLPGRAAGDDEGELADSADDPMRRSVAERSRGADRDREADRLLREPAGDAGDLARAVRHLAMNAAAAEFFGVSMEAGSRATLADLGLGDAVARRWADAVAEAWSTGETAHFECRVGHDNGNGNGGASGRVLRVHVSRIDGGTASGRKFCYVAENVTRLGRAERARDLLRAAVENTDEPLLVVGAGDDPAIEYANPSFAALFGDHATHDGTTFEGRPLRSLLGAKSEHDLIERFANDGRGFRRETFAYAADGRELVVGWTASPIPGDDGHVERWVVALRDNTARRSLERQVLDVQERERERIARDLHDTVAQQLNTLTLYVGTVRRELASAGTATQEQLDDLGEAIEQARLAAEQARSLSHTLGSVDVREQGLAEALRRLASRTQLAYGVEVTAEVAEVDERGPLASRDAEMQLYRIAGEAVNNAVRHGKPTSVQIRLGDTADSDDARGQLTVADDGVGLPAALVEMINGEPDARAGEAGGIGLSSMRYRASLIGGGLRVAHNDGPADRPGTLLTCVFPRQHDGDGNEG